MGLKETQALLAHLFTDAPLRRAFFDTPEKVAARFGLSGEEAAQLAALDRDEVDAFARSLFGKRALDARKAMPLTARVLGETFNAVLYDVLSAERKQPGGDCAMLTERLTEMSARGGLHPPWLADLARFELACLDAARPGLHVRRFRHDVEAIANRPPDANMEIAPCATIGVWARAKGGRLRWRLYRLPRWLGAA